MDKHLDEEMIQMRVNHTLSQQSLKNLTRYTTWMTALHSLTNELDMDPHHWLDTLENVLTSLLKQDLQIDYSSATLAQLFHLFFLQFESKEDLQQMVLDSVNTFFNELQQNDNALSQLESLLKTFYLSFSHFRLLTQTYLEMFFARGYELEQVEYILVSWMDEFTEENLAMKFSTKLVHELLKWSVDEMAGNWQMVMSTLKLFEPWILTNLRNLESRLDDMEDFVHIWEVAIDRAEVFHLNTWKQFLKLLETQYILIQLEQEEALKNHPTPDQNDEETAVKVYNNLLDYVKAVFSSDYNILDRLKSAARMMEEDGATNEKNIISVLRSMLINKIGSIKILMQYESPHPALISFITVYFQSTQDNVGQVIAMETLLTYGASALFSLAEIFILSAITIHNQQRYKKEFLY
uniref:Uncharacterized protein n=1 Tax=Ditylenchus dipsaci TaxID=166011 RepID=A0A915CYK6_9BILA